MIFSLLPERSRGYAIAVLTVALGISVRFALNPVLGNDSPLLIFTLPVVVTALYGGSGPALLATALAVVLGSYLFMGGGGWPVMNGVNITRVVMFMLIGLAVSLLGGRLQASRHALLAAHSRKDEFLAMLGHELRNPLASISAAAELLRRAHETPEAGQLASVHVIRRQVKHMAQLIDDLLDVTRIARGHVVLTKKRVDLREVVHDAVEQMGPLLVQKCHTLTLEDASAEPVEVMGDHARLVQVLANMLMNGAKYTAPGGKLKLALKLDGSQVKVEVADNGVGIAPDLLPHVFDAFVQAERTADRAEGGLGLGLALVKSVVAMHGGRVLARSDGLNQGSTFTVVLPRLQAQGGKGRPSTEGLHGSSPGPAQVASPERSLRIMVVDDNADAAVSLGQLLESYGHAVTVAFDAEQALQQAQEQSFDVALLDIGLPGLNGYELAARLRRMPRLASCLLLALTGYGTQTDSDRSKAAGFDHHLVKPLDLDFLFSLLSERLPTQPLH